jgi:ppGpp synthetase/RelA/SpoT-type nucleotidyltranferase
MELDICKKRKRRVDGYVTDKELTDLLEDYAGVKVTAEWLKEIRSKKSEVENG